MAIISGENAKVTFGSGPITFNNTSWKVTIKPNIKDVSNTRDGRKKIKTLIDADGSFSGFWDDAAQATDDIAVGDIGIIKLYVDSTKFLTFLAIIDDVDIDTKGVEDGITVGVKFQLESGVITYPV